MLLRHIETVLNSRPIAEHTTDKEDLQALTPSFLLSLNTFSVPRPDHFQDFSVPRPDHFQDPNHFQDTHSRNVPFEATDLRNTRFQDSGSWDFQHLRDASNDKLRDTPMNPSQDLTMCPTRDFILKKFWDDLKESYIPILERRKKFFGLSLSCSRGALVLINDPSHRDAHHFYVGRLLGFRKDRKQHYNLGYVKHLKPNEPTTRVVGVDLKHLIVLAPII